MAWRELFQDDAHPPGLAPWEHDFDVGVSFAVREAVATHWDSSSNKFPRGIDFETSGRNSGIKRFGVCYPIHQNRHYPWGVYSATVGAGTNEEIRWAPPIPESLKYKHLYGDLIEADCMTGLFDQTYTAHLRPSTTVLPPSLCTLSGRLVHCPFDVASYIEGKFTKPPGACDRSCPAAMAVRQAGQRYGLYGSSDCGLRSNLRV